MEPAAEVARQVRRRRISAVEVVRARIDRIERRNPSLNAFVNKDFDDACRDPVHSTRIWQEDHLRLDADSAAPDTVVTVTPAATSRKKRRS